MYVFVIIYSILFFTYNKTLLLAISNSQEQFINIHTYLAQTPEIGQDLGRFLSCEARKQEHFLRIVSRLRKTIYHRTGVRTHGHRCVRPTLYLLHHSRLLSKLTV